MQLASDNLRDILPVCVCLFLQRSGSWGLRNLSRELSIQLILPTCQRHPEETSRNGLGTSSQFLSYLFPSTALGQASNCPVGSQKPAGNECPGCCRQVSALGTGINMHLCTPRMLQQGPRCAGCSQGSEGPLDVVKCLHLRGPLLCLHSASELTRPFSSHSPCSPITRRMHQPRAAGPTPAAGGHQRQTHAKHMGIHVGNTR